MSNIKWHSSEVFSIAATSIYATLLPRNKVLKGHVAVFIHSIKRGDGGYAKTTGDNGYIVLTREFHGINLCDPINGVAVLAHEIGHWAQSMGEQKGLAQTVETYAGIFGPRNANLALDITGELLMTKVIPWTGPIMANFVRKVTERIAKPDAVARALVKAFRMRYGDPQALRENAEACIGAILAYIRFFILPEAMAARCMTQSWRPQIEDLPLYSAIMSALTSEREQTDMRNALRGCIENLDRMRKRFTETLGEENENISSRTYAMVTRHGATMLQEMVNGFLDAFVTHFPDSDSNRRSGKALNKAAHNGKQSSDTAAGEGENDNTDDNIDDNTDDNTDGDTNGNTDNNTDDNVDDIIDLMRESSSLRLAQRPPKTTETNKSLTFPNINKFDAKHYPSCQARFTPEEVLYARLVAVHVWPQTQKAECRGMPHYSVISDLREDPVPFRRSDDETGEKAQRPTRLIVMLDASDSMFPHRYEVAKTVANALVCAAQANGLDTKLVLFGDYIAILEEAKRFPETNECAKISQDGYIAIRRNLRGDTRLDGLERFIRTNGHEAVMIIVTDGEIRNLPWLQPAIRHGIYVVRIVETAKDDEEERLILENLKRVSDRITITPIGDLRTAVIAALPPHPQAMRVKGVDIGPVLSLLGVRP